MRRTLAVVLVLAACGSTQRVGGARDGHVPGTPFKPGDPIPAGGGPTVAVKVDLPAPAEATVAEMVGGRRRGVPHFAQINSVVVDRAGTRALTRDFIGQVRIWPSLDGTIEPQRVPVTAPEAMAIAARDDGGSLAALIDAAGIVTLVHFDGDGLVRATATLPPDVPYSGIAMIDGARVAVVRSDQRIILLDGDGVELSHLSVRSSRVIALHAAGDHLVAITRRAEDDRTIYEVRRLSTTDGTLAWDGDGHTLPAAVAAAPQVVSAVSPGGSILAYLYANDSQEVFAKLIRVATGKEVKLDGPLQATTPQLTSMGFTDATHLEMVTTGGTGWRVEIEKDQATAVGMAVDSSSSAPAYADGARIAGYQGTLVVRKDGGDAMYLGYRDTSPTAGTLAGDGSCAAWTTGTGAILVQRFDGSADLRIKSGNDWFNAATVIDEGHVIGGRSNGTVAMFDSHTGEEIAQAVVATSSPFFVYMPTTKLLAVLRDTGTVWVMPIDTKQDDPFGEPIAVSDGATTFQLLDPDLAGGDVLLTVDASMNQRRYTAKMLENGLTASEIKKAKVGTVTYAYGYDRLGEAYQLNGGQVELRGKGDSTIVQLPTTSPTGVFVSPKGDQIAVLQQPGASATVTVVDRKGKEKWSVSSRGSLYWTSWSEDQTRAIVLGQGGAIVVDASTGEQIATALGWAFGLTNEVPSAFPPGVDPGFE